jgi:hypothetical protein|eukprot:COSAG06_NODE_2827_length_6216_cov_1.565310_8_plen_47_part_00
MRQLLFHLQKRALFLVFPVFVPNLSWQIFGFEYKMAQKRRTGGWIG